MLHTRWLPMLLILLLLGCGYHPLGAAPATSKGAPTLAIPLFANRSTEIGLEATLASALINAFAKSKAVRVISGDQNADLILEGKVRSVDNTSVAFQDITHSTVRRITVRVELVLKKGESGKVLWKDFQVLQENYVVDPTYHIGEATKIEGLNRAAVSMARRVVDKVLLVI